MTIHVHSLVNLIDVPWLILTQESVVGMTSGIKPPEMGVRDGLGCVLGLKHSDGLFANGKQDASNYGMKWICR